jgi:hypothetical protein
MPREELDMTTIRRLIATLAGLAFVIGYGAPAALANTVLANTGLANRPEPTSGPVPIEPSVPASAPTIVHPGSPLWQFVAVAALAIAATAMVTLAIESLRGRRLTHTQTAHV